MACHVNEWEKCIRDFPSQHEHLRKIQQLFKFLAIKTWQNINKNVQ